MKKSYQHLFQIDKLIKIFQPVFVRKTFNPVSLQSLKFGYIFNILKNLFINWTIYYIIIYLTFFVFKVSLKLFCLLSLQEVQYSGRLKDSLNEEKSLKGKLVCLIYLGVNSLTLLFYYRDFYTRCNHTQITSELITKSDNIAANILVFIIISVRYSSKQEIWKNCASR